MDTDIQDLELHDARLLGVRFDPTNAQVDVELAYYPTTQSAHRLQGTIRFEGVSQFHQLADLTELNRNAGPGNVGYWIPSAGRGITYIYLVRGLIAITAESLQLLEG